MTHSRKGYKILAAALVLFALFFCCGFTLWSVGEDVLNGLGAYSLLENWRNPQALHEEMDSTIRYHIPYRMEVRDIFSASLVARGKRDTGTFFIVKDRKDYLHQTNLFQAIDTDVAEYARRMGNLCDEAARVGAQTLFVGTSGKFVPDQTEMPNGYPLDYSSLWNLDALLINLLAYRVPNLDLREDFTEVPLAYEDCYYRTDRYWTAKAALYAADCIAAEAREAFGMQINADGFYSDLSHYKTTLYPRTLLGNIGRTAGIPFSGLDDFKLLTPTFETDLTVEILWGDAPRSGPFSESILDVSYLERADPRYNNPSNAYFGEDIIGVKIVNNLPPSDEKILLLCDEAFKTAAAYLALMCAEVEVRIVTESSITSMERLVGEGGYALVVVACEARSIAADMFPFFKSGLYQREES